MACAEIEIKKSRFIGYAAPIDSREQGMAWLAQIKTQYPDARHHCWAYLMGNPACASNAGMGDDGEPSGTAGKPILNVLQHKGVGDIMIIVVRYFGGIKLGAGGLTRAYGQAAQAVMDVLPVIEQVAKVVYDLSLDFKHEQFVRHCCDLCSAQVAQVTYGKGVTIRVSLPETEQTHFIQKMTDNGILYQQEP
ncbi:MAG: YigZ family protein [Thiotrichales bacterium]|nr:YigZ family protein [Thiotrichales bacterium]